MKHSKGLAALALALFGFSYGASAADFSFSGNLATDDSLQLFNFTWNGTSSAVIQSKGGISGGFDTILSLYSPTGSLLGFNDDSVLGIDSMISLPFVPGLSAGIYLVTLTQFSNFPPSDLADPFPGSNRTNFNGRTSAWTIEFLDVQTASLGGIVPPNPSVPESGSSLALLSAAVAGVIGFRRKRGSA